MELRPVRLDPMLVVLLVGLLCYLAGTLRGYLAGRNDRRVFANAAVDAMATPRYEGTLEVEEPRPFDWMRDVPPSWVKDPDLSRVAGVRRHGANEDYLT